MNEDVLHRVFENFDLQPGSKTAAQTRKDLLSAAKACKAFVEPALDSLWRVLPSLLPLLLLLPSAVVVNDEYSVDNLSFNNSSWERFEIHARRVRTLYMETPRITISPIIYIHIRSMRDNPLLPGLKAIYIPDGDPVDFPSIILLALGVSLDIVELNHSATSERNFFIPFLTSLTSKSPNLAHLALRGSESVPLEPVYLFTNLQHLEIRLPGTYLYPETLRRLENLTNLQELIIDVGASVPVKVPTVDSKQLSTFSPSRKFGMLRKLHIIGIPSSITRVLDDINLVNLTTLVVDEASDDIGRHTQSFWERLFGQVSVCQAIENIEINQSARQGWDHRHYSLCISWFTSLLTLNGLKSLVINGSALSGSDEDFRLLAYAFPKLKKLVVPPVYYSKGRTLACLFYFSQYCPELEEIKICLGSDILKNLDAVENIPHPIPVNRRHPLRKLHINSKFGPIELTHSIQVAEFLDLLFPNLSTLEAYYPNTTDTANWANTTEASNWAGIQEFRMSLKNTRVGAYKRAMSEMDMVSNN